MSSLIKVPFGILLPWKHTVLGMLGEMISTSTWEQGINSRWMHSSASHALEGRVQHTSSDGLKWASRHTGAKICPQSLGLMILSRYLGPCFTLHHSTILLYCLQHLHNCHYKTVTHEMAAVQMQCQPQQLEQNLSLSHKETGTKFCDDRTTGWDFPP